MKTYERAWAHTKDSRTDRKGFFSAHHRTVGLAVSSTPIHMTVLGVIETAVIVHQAPIRCCQNTFKMLTAGLLTLLHLNTSPLLEDRRTRNGF
jgi:hypothetical protein